MALFADHRILSAIAGFLYDLHLLQRVRVRLSQVRIHADLLRQPSQERANSRFIGLDVAAVPADSGGRGAHEPAGREVLQTNPVQSSLPDLDVDAPVHSGGYHGGEPAGVFQEPQPISRRMVGSGMVRPFLVHCLDRADSLDNALRVCRDIDHHVPLSRATDRGRPKLRGHCLAGLLAGGISPNPSRCVLFMRFRFYPLLQRIYPHQPVERRVRYLYDLCGELHAEHRYGTGGLRNE